MTAYQSIYIQDKGCGGYRGTHDYSITTYDLSYRPSPYPYKKWGTPHDGSNLDSLICGYLLDPIKGKERYWIGTTYKTRGFQIEDVFAEKVDLLRGRVYQLLSLLDERRRIRYKNIYRIDQDICTCKTLLLELYHWPVGSSFTVERKRGQLELQILRFEEEKRKEDLAFWKDKWQIGKELFEAIREYRSALRKSRLLLG
jgi:hypothetical protein